MQNPIGEADLEWILHRNCEGTEQLRRIISDNHKLKEERFVAGRVISIEIGNSLTRVCELDYKSRNHKVYGHFTIPTPEGMIQDGVLRSNEAFVADLKDALADNGMKAKQVMFTLTSTKIASREVTIPLVKENRIMDVVNANASDYFPVDLSQYQLAYSMLDIIGDPKSGQQYKLLVLAAPQALLDGYYELAKALKLELAALDYAGNSIYQVVKDECKEQAQMIVKIEESATMVLVVYHSSISFIRSVSYGVQEALEQTFRLPLKNRIETTEQALELLSKKSFVVLNETTQESEGSEEEKSREQEFCEAMTDALTPLIGAVTRVVDYYVSHNSNIPLEKILLTGLGADIKGVHKLLAGQLGYPIEILRQAEGWNLEKNFEGKFFGEYVACIGAAADPLGFKTEREKGRESKAGVPKSEDDTKGRTAAIIICAGGVALAVVLSVISGVRFLTVKSVNHSLQEQMTSLAEIKPIYDTYISTKADYDKIKQMYDVTRNRNDDLYEFMEELERKMPSNAVITSFTSDSQTVTINMLVSTKTEAASMIEQFRTFDSLLPETVSVSALTAQTDGNDAVLAYNFTITGAYRDLDELPQEEQGDAWLSQDEQNDAESVQDEQNDTEQVLEEQSDVQPVSDEQDHTDAEQDMTENDDLLNE